MEIIIQSPHFKARTELTDFVKNKVTKLSRFYGNIETANVFLKIEKTDGLDNKVCEIRLAIPGNDLFASKHSDTFENAASKAVDALHEQIERSKNKIKDSL